MKRLVLLASLAGCVGTTREVTHVGVNAKLDDRGVRGGEAAASWTLDGVGAQLAVGGEHYKRPVFDGEQARFGGGIDLALRVSLFGLFAQDHRIDHWFDIGGAAGAGGGLIYPARLTTYGEAWVGGWLALGLYPGNAGYPSLLLDVRREAVTDWNDATVFSVGLAWTHRYLGDPTFGFR